MADLLISIDFEDDVTAREADHHTRTLMRRFERLDVDEVCMAEGEVEAGTRSGDPVTIAGAIALVGATLKLVLPHIVSVAETWLQSSEQRSVTIEVDGTRFTVNGRRTPTPQELEEYVSALRERKALAEGEQAHDGDQP